MSIVVTPKSVDLYTCTILILGIVHLVQNGTSTRSARGDSAPQKTTLAEHTGAKKEHTARYALFGLGKYPTERLSKRRLLKISLADLVGSARGDPKA